MFPLNFQKAMEAGKKTFKVSKEDEARYVLASSYEQCHSKFRGWNIQEISKEEFLSNK